MKMKMRARFVLDSSLLVMYLVAMNTAVTGIPVHEWLSVVVASVIIVHLLTEWDWTIHVVSRFFKRLAGLSRFNLLVDVLLFAAVTLVMLSGFLVSESILPLMGISVPFGPTWRMVHAIAADFSMVLLGVHLGLHWRWFVSAFKRTFLTQKTTDVASQEA